LNRYIDMKYLCLAYGNEEDWNELGSLVQSGLLAQDELLRKRGDVVAAVNEKTTIVKAWDGVPETTDKASSQAHIPLTGFYIIEADDKDHAIHLVSETPCARAGGHIEIREIAEINGQELSSREGQTTIP
jgi:hypothetical protein